MGSFWFSHTGEKVSGKQGWIRTARIEAATVLALSLLFAFWSNGWLMKENFWGIDDPKKLSVTREVVAALHEEGIRGGWETLRELEGNNNGLTMSLYLVFTCALFGAKALWPYHVLKGLQHAFWIFLIWGTARNLGGRRLGAVCAVLFGVFCNSTVLLPDMQTYSANWWRLYTTDSFGALPLALFWWSASMAVIKPRRRVGWLLLAAVAYVLSLQAKGTYLYLFPAVAVAAAFAFAGNAIPRRRPLPILLCLGALFVIGGLTIVFYGVGVSGVTVLNYEAFDPSFSPQRLIEGWKFYSQVLEDTGAWLWLLAIAGGVVLMIRLVQRRRVPPIAARWRLVLVLTLLVAGAGGLILQSAWPIRIPRYMMAFMPTLSLGAGISIGWLHYEFTRPQRRRTKRFTSWERTAFASAVLLYLLALGILFLPTEQGKLRLAAFAVLMAGAVCATAVLWRLQRRRQWRHAVGPALLSGFIAVTVLTQAVVLALNYLEARAAFQAIYRGENLLKTQARAVPPAPPGETWECWTNISGEFRLNTFWFLHTYDGRTDLRLIERRIPETVTPPAAVHMVKYPHPPDELRWLTPGFAQWRLVPWTESGEIFAEIRYLGLDDPPIRIELTPTERRALLGRVVLRFDTGDVPFTDDLRITLATRDGEELTSETWRGVESPRQRTNRVPVDFDPPPVLRPGVSHVLFVDRIKDPEYERSIFRVFIRDGVKTPFLTMYADETKQGLPRPGFKAYLAQPWTEKGGAPKVLRATEARTAFHVEAPAAVLRRLVELGGYGYSTQAVRWVRYPIHSTMAIFPERKD